ELGVADAPGWGLRLGRQELALGDERLVGADSFWDNLGQSFDAVQVYWSRPQLKLNGFVSFKVTANQDRMATPDSGNQLYGLFASWTTGPGEGVVQPYLLWNHVRYDGPGSAASVVTTGIRAVGALGRGFDYNVEMAVQAGRRPESPIRAWAGHWEVGYKILA